jgi:hypothetical protein
VRFTEIDLFGAYIASDVADDGRGMVCHDRTAPDRQPIRLVGVRAERFRRRLFGGGFHGAAIGVAWRGAAVGRCGDCGWNPGWRDGGGWGAASNLLLRTFRFQADQRSDRDDFPRRPACGSLAPSTS